MREEGRIDKSSHRWRDAVATGLPSSFVLRLAFSELEGGGWRGQREEEGRWRVGVRRRGGGGLVSCLAVSGCGSCCQGIAALWRLAASKWGRAADGQGDRELG
jgi:hypothetical protein